MDEVADAAGVTKPVLYQHFRSKRDLFTQILTDIGDQLLEQFRKATDGALSPRETVEAGFLAYFRFLDSNPDAFRLLFGAVVRHDPEFGAIVESVVERLAAAVVPLVEVDGTAEQRDVLAHALVGMAEAVGRLMLGEADAARPPVEAEQLAAWVLELAWFGLRGRRQSPNIARMAPSPTARGRRRPGDQAASA
jgi:AcrR family transcriptional regulator